MLRIIEVIYVKMARIKKHERIKAGFFTNILYVEIQKNNKNYVKKIKKVTYSVNLIIIFKF